MPGDFSSKNYTLELTEGVKLDEELVIMLDTIDIEDERFKR